MKDPGEMMGELTKEVLKGIVAQRTEILRAFVAKYGFQPDEAVQIHQITPDGVRWWIQRKPYDDKKEPT